MEVRSSTVCRECMRALRQSTRTNGVRYTTQQWTRRSFITAPEIKRQKRTIEPASTTPQRRPFTTTCPLLREGVSNDLNVLHTRIFDLTTSALRPEDSPLPTEQRILYVLEQLDAIANSLIDEKSLANAQKQRVEQETTATSALLGSVSARSYPAFLSKAALLNLVSEKAEEIVRDENVFISPSVLRAYVELQARSHQPASFPEVLRLYAEKPLPKESSDKSRVEYTPVSPNAPNSAVDTDTATTALKAAITAHDLPLCLDVIARTFSTPSYKRAKLIRRALVPATALTATPFLAYTAAQQYSHLLQSTMSEGYATGVAFAGIMTYTGVVASLGYIVITTTNDQMERVTWAKGVPLWERWVREEERAALDQVAVAWGFPGLDRRGEEEGVEWEELREEVGSRGMVLDKVELMEGME